MKRHNIKIEWTVRQKCKEGLIKAEKVYVGGGRRLRWIISVDEVKRLRNYQ